MKNTYQKRLDKADTIAREAVKSFERAAADLELASQMHRETYDDLENQIAVLEARKSYARKEGERATANAKKLREFFL